MADVNTATDGPEPYDPSAFDFTLLPDYNNDFVHEDDIVEFARALQAPELSPSAEDLTLPEPTRGRFITALNDWRPIRQRVRRRKKHKKPPQRGRDETREGYWYGLLKWPLFLGIAVYIACIGMGYILTRFYVYMYEHWWSWRGRRQRLRAQLQRARTYEDWIKAAEELDAYLGNDEWKDNPDYAYYDCKTIRKVHHQMAKLRQRAEADEQGTSNGNGATDHKTAEDLRALVEACMKNNFVGFENPRLYSETYYGTKNQVQEFIDEAEQSLNFLVRTTQLDSEAKRAFFKHVSTNFGRTALCLSGGATFAYYHFGLAKALLDADLLPEVITGTSGGALVAALLGTRTNEELKKLLVPALAHRITACHDDILTWTKRFYRTGARFDSVDWAARSAWFTRGSMTFKEAYQRTGRILNVSCVPSDPHSPTILANYITAPDCVIWSAVLASAAVPGILNPVVLMKKNKDGTLAPYSFGHKWKDGSLRTDIPLKALSIHFNVRFSIVSQVNPHINIFFFSSRGSVGRPVTHRRGRGWRGGFLGSALEQYFKLELTKCLKVLRHLELLPRLLGQDWSEIWLQRFSGTITIWPKTIWSDFWYILTDPTPERLARMIHVGQQSAFSKLKFIANRAKLEHAIQKGRVQFRPRTTQEGGLLTSIMSEEDLRGLLQRAKSDRSDFGGIPYPLSGSDSSTTGPSAAPLTTQRTPPPSDQPPIPDSPSLSQRLSGWWSSKPRQAPPAGGIPGGRITSPPAPHLNSRPNSMFELRPSTRFLDTSKTPTPTFTPPPGVSPSRTGSFFQELRRQSSVFVDDDLDLEDDGIANYGDAGKRYDGRDGDKGIAGDEGADANGGAEDYGDGFGDDEDEGDIDGEDQVQNVGVGLGLEG
ncbi:patatin-domain-containing protein [Lentithecium fluviatile CBS 122367]|uniref:Patatin-like phospholipase domain-containing protein n=1 Tax=Lentithecium fluviatile CBS 122367 TaxID=1168545 RepID=A0A6G1JLV8_9PLEO|nr:patatin-domain-containing protein [Lentithecium fluviatile CBS 122367]